MYFRSKYIPVVIISQAFILLSACSKQSQDVEATVPELQISKSVIDLRGIESYQDSFHIESNTQWNVNVSSANTTWLSASVSSGTNSRWVVITATEENRSNETRTATIDITPGDNSQLPAKKISISQRIFDLQDSATLLIGKWRYTKDSSTNVDFYFQEGGHNWYPTPGVYIGNDQDYINFRTDGTMTTHVNNNTYNSAYQLLPVSQLSIDEMLTIGIANVIKLNRTEAIIDWKSTSPNGGQYFRRAFLSR